MTRKKGKKPLSHRKPKGTKEPNQHPSLDISKRHFEWSVDQIDFEGRWGWGKIEIKFFIETILKKLKHYETMAWSEVEGSNSHFIPVNQIDKFAKDRLRNRHLFVEQLFSLRITGKKRVWGYREKKIFYLLWWDPEHQVCPSYKRHT